MVQTEIRAPRVNAETREIEWSALASVRAENGQLDMSGDDSVVQRGPVVSLALGRSVHPSEEPEEWTRNLPHAYRGGDLVAVVVRDDDPPAVVSGSYPDLVEPDIPAPAGEANG